MHIGIWYTAFVNQERKYMFMYGAIVGDIIGSPYEFNRGQKKKEFDLFASGAAFTDDTVMTVAVAEAFLNAGKDADLETIRQNVVQAMQHWGRKYPNAGYGGRFRYWLQAPIPRPYGSYGNGSAMRVSAAGWLYDSLERTRAVARATAEVTHNHREGIKGAEAVASVIYLARNGKRKEEIREYVRREFHYRLDRTIDEIRPYYHHVESCQETVPEAITAFMEGEDFEDVIRTAVSLGGDCDTLTDIAGAMAEAFYGIPAILRAEVRNRVKPDMLAVLDRFDRILNRQGGEHDCFLKGNEKIEAAISRLGMEGTRESMAAVLDAIHRRMLRNGHFLLPTRMKFDIHDFVDLGKVKVGDVVTNNEPLAFEFCTVQSPDGKQWMVAFTSEREYRKGESVNGVLSQFIDWIFDATLRNDRVEGIVINPWGEALTLPKEMLSLFFGTGRHSANTAGTNRNSRIH